MNELFYPLNVTSLAKIFFYGLCGADTPMSITLLSSTTSTGISTRNAAAIHHVDHEEDDADELVLHNTETIK